MTRTCEAAGFAFTSMVLEAHGGGWSPLMQNAVDWIAKVRLHARMRLQASFP